MSCALKKSLSAALLSLLCSARAMATQLIEDADRAHQQAAISVNEPNRLAVEGRRIAHVVPSKKGALSVVKDEARGALYFALADPSPNPGTLTLFVSDDQGVTYKLILVPQPIAGEEIVLRPSSGIQRPTSAGNGCSAHRAASVTRRIKALIRAMAAGEADGVDILPIHQTVPLWTTGRLVLLNQYRTNTLVGEHYRLTNTSSTEYPLAEQALYRRGIDAVAVEHALLAAGESTNIFIVRARQDDE